MGGLHISTNRLTKQNAATIGVSLVILGMLWDPYNHRCAIYPSKTEMRWERAKKPLYI